MPARLLLPTALAIVASLALPAGAFVTLVTATGHVGPLHIDRSTRAEIIQFAGAPAAEVHASETPDLP